MGGLSKLATGSRLKKEKNMPLPGFTADASLPNPTGFYAVRNLRASAGDKSVVELQQIGLRPLPSSMSTARLPAAPGRLQIHYAPRCYNQKPFTPLGEECRD